MKKTTLIISSLIFVFFVLTSCSDGSTGDDTATISISLGMGSAAGKAAVSIDQLTHIIKLSGPTETQTLTIEGGGSVTATVAPGLWKINVEGYLDKDLYSVGMASAEVKARKNTDVSIQMTVVWANPNSGGKGGGGGSVTTGNSSTSGISLSPTAHTFPAATVGYGALTPLTVTVTNAGNQETGGLSVGISGTDPGSFTLSTTAISSIAASGTDTFTVEPNTGLGIGTYTATVTVSGGNGISKSFNVSFTVDPTPIYTLSAALITGQSSAYGSASITGGTTTGNAAGDSVEVTAMPNSGYSFVKWVSSDDINGATISTNPVYAFAITANTDLYAVFNGDGLTTPKNISSVAELQGISSDLTGNYALMADIDLTAPWTRLGVYVSGFSPYNDPFDGTFDGNGHTISGLNITGSSTSQGLFGYIGEYGTVRNLRLNVNSIINSGSSEVGAVAGHSEGLVENCYVNVNGTIQGTTSVGGIVGRNYGTVQNCFSVGSGNIDATSNDAGGIVGINETNADPFLPIVKNCYSMLDVSGGNRIGGIVGCNFDGSIENCAALNTSVATTVGTDIGRVAGGTGGSLTSPSYSNNYAWTDMPLTIVGSTYTSNPISDDNGDEVDPGSAIGQYNDQDFWDSTLGWDFSSTWKWGSNNLPALQ